MTDLTTIPALRQAVKKAPAVYAQIRFGISERWMKITKTEALALLDTIPDDMTPEKFEMFGGTTFGKIEEDGTVSLG